MAERDPKTGRFPKGNGSKGRGWGGPAKGASTSRIKPGDPDGITALRWDEAKIAEKQTRVDALKGVIWDIAMAPDSEPALRITAADKLLDRELGKPGQAIAMGGPNGGPVMVVTGVPRADDPN